VKVTVLATFMYDGSERVPSLDNNMAYPHLNSGSGGMSDQSDIMTDVIVDPYPGQFTKAHMGPMMGVHTRVTSYYLPDRIIIQVSQNNKLSQQVS
jgi:hypothetical protein